MSLKRRLREIKRSIDRVVFLLTNRKKERFECPICGYSGPFMDVHPATGLRKHAKCPKCGALERHRLQYLVLNTVFQDVDPSALKMLHFAPEPFFVKFFSKRFSGYETADLCMEGVDHRVDLQELPFEDQTYDFVFASHVLEHIPDDNRAIAEIRRILKPNGIAVLPVPLVAQQTIEYPAPNPNESGHVRAPGFDYFDRYSRHFSKVEKYDSASFPEKHQVFICECRTHWPTEQCPLRQPMPGEKHRSVVPVCYV